VNRQVLRLLLKQAFPESASDQRRVVARMAGDLADSGRYREVKQRGLTPQAVVANLEDAADEYSLLERWNWWIGALDLAHGSHDEFRVRGVSESGSTSGSGSESEFDSEPGFDVDG
jgi:hypothetical protein